MANRPAATENDAHPLLHFFRRERRGSRRRRSLPRRGYGDGSYAVAVAVDEIAPEHDDRYRSGYGPVRAAVRSEPFAQHALVAWNSRRLGHVHFSCFIVILENALGPAVFPGRQGRCFTSLIIDDRR